MSNIEWLCARCAKKEDKETEPDPVVLRLCTSCKVENWVRPFGHSGEGVIAEEEETEAAKVYHAELSAQKVPKAKEPVVEAVSEPEPELEVVAVLEEIPTDDETIDAAIEAGKKEAEIAALKAQIAELEK